MSKLFFLMLVVSLNIALALDVVKAKKLSNDIGLNHVADTYNVSKYLLLAIADIESSLNPFAIGISETSNYKMWKTTAYLKKLNIKHKRQGSDLSVYPENHEEAKKSYMIIQFFELKNYGIGYSQLSRANIERLNLDVNRLFTDTQYNFKYSAKILNDCFYHNKKKLYSAMECYYKGTNSNKYTFGYATKVANRYIKVKNKIGVL